LGIVGLGVAELYIIGYNLPGFWGFFPVAMGYLAIAFSQFFFGWISDKWYTRLGRRKPWILLLAPLSFVSFICLFLPDLFLHNPSQSTVIAWLILWDIMFEVAYAVSTPYGAWMAEEFTLDERPRVSQITNTFNFIGYGIMAVFTLVVLTNFSTQLSQHPGVLPPVYVWSCFIFGLIFFVSYYVCALVMPTEAPPKTKPDLRKNLRNIVENKNYMHVVIMQGFASLTWIAATGVMLLYTQKVLGFGLFDYILAGLTLLFGIFIFLYVWRVIVAKWGKTKTLLVVFVLAMCVMSCSLLGFVPFPSTMVFGILFIGGTAVFLAGWYLLSSIWYADLAQDDAQKTGEMKAGLYAGFPSILLNIFQALGTFILALLVTLPNFTVVTATYSHTFSIGYVVYGPIFAACLLLTYFYTRNISKVQLDVAKQELTHEEPVKDDP
jgi:Na+/melibiose symporter-like transporter